MKILKPIINLPLIFSGLLLSSSLSALDIVEVTPTNIWSYTFDGNTAAPNPNNEFVPDLPSSHESNVAFTPVGTVNGGNTLTGKGVIEFNGDRLISASLIFPDMDVLITDEDAGNTSVVTTGATLTLTPPAIDGDDLSDGIIQLDGFNISTFTSDTVVDFSTLNNVLVDGCDASINGPGCAAIGFTNLDGIKYELEGQITPQGGDIFKLKYWTANGSIFMLEFVTATTTEFSNISAVNPINIWSYTFDGNTAAPNPNNEFVPDVPSGHVSNVAFTPVGTDNGGSTLTGTGIVEFNGDRLILATVLFPDMNVLITDEDAGNTSVETTGATLTITPPAIDGDDLSDGMIQLDGFNVSTFTSDTVVDFSTLNSVLVDGCDAAVNGPGCAAIGFTNLDGIKYELEGQITPQGGDTLKLKYWTANGSIFMVEFVTAIPTPEVEPTNVPVPFIAIAALGLLLGLITLRKKST